jgi:hypothetical protein
MKTRSIITYRVFTLDVWGHSSEECEPGLGCPCCVPCPTTGADKTAALDESNPKRQGWIHSPDDKGEECDGEYIVNDRCNVGSIEVETDFGATYNTTPEDRRNGWTFTVWNASDEALVATLIEGSFLADHVKAEDLEFNGEQDDLLTIDRAKDGRPLLQLEYDSSHLLPGN